MFVLKILKLKEFCDILLSLLHTCTHVHMQLHAHRDL